MNIFNDGSFFIGVNYWASHAGTYMWRDWQPQVIEKDLEVLAKANIKNLRIFPLWSDFQPICMLYGVQGNQKEIRMGDMPLPHTTAGRAGVDKEMVERFRFFCDCAHKNGINLVVGLLTGWMSGRLFVPPLLENINLFTDPTALKWETKFVRYMVSEFKYHPAISAWDLGNECNCLSRGATADIAYAWASAITMAIKAEDNSRPVISGMHGTFPEGDFRPQDLGEILDILCTHPYPCFTPHCETDPITEQKPAMHAVAETLMYRGLSGKPAFAEEVGNLGPLMSSNENASEYANTILHLLWAHNCMGFMWWCAFEQNHLSHPPYDWIHIERELGVMYADYTQKPIMPVMSDFAKFIDTFEYDALPKRITDAVCIISQSNESWLSAYGTFTLAKQTGLDIEFAYKDCEIPHSRAYIIPSLESYSSISRHVSDEIFKRVEDGAVLYISLKNDGGFSEFERIFKLKLLYRYQPTSGDKVELDGTTFSLSKAMKNVFKSCGAEVIACDSEDNPVMIKTPYGKGTIYLLDYPIENIAASQPCVISGRNETPYYKFYEKMPLLRNPEKCAKCDNVHVVITEHIVDDNTRIIIAVNCVPRTSDAVISLDGLKLSRVLKNQQATINGTDKITLSMKPNSAAVLEIKK
ncbi:MAG: hypothetical protein E7588_00890 [Ruminococcaceae bacterium]|nr:hypothetical protein [Oscillospiraceae bacterium]